MVRHTLIIAPALLIAVLLLGARGGASDLRGDTGAVATAAPAAVPGAVSETRPVIIFLDPGHGGSDPGWGSVHLVGVPAEKELTLDLAMRTAAYLERDGFQVVLSRTTDTDVNEPPRDRNRDGCIDVQDEMIARVERANASGAAVLLSLHFNASPGSPSLGGTMTIFNDKRGFNQQNRRLASLVHEAQRQALRDFGHEARDWGIIADDELNAPSQSECDAGYEHFMLLGPAGVNHPQPSTMPGAIVESLFLTNPREAALAQDDSFRDALAKAYAGALRAFLAGS
jgi:N-acetylmuramoyl-L-alanine amidase